MVSDNTTFFLSFGAIFAALGVYLYRLEKQVNALRRRLDDARKK